MKNRLMCRLGCAVRSNLPGTVDREAFDTADCLCLGLFFSWALPRRGVLQNLLGRGRSTIGQEIDPELCSKMKAIICDIERQIRENYMA